MKKLISQKEFFQKYKIDQKEFKKTNLNWEDLDAIFQDYCNEVPQLEASAIYIFNKLMKTPNVHSVRYRIKDEEHVIEKIIRKRIKDPETIISLNNYKDELTDLIGIRALHLFKEEWLSIHDLITSTWELKQKPVANYREGDPSKYLEHFKELGCETKVHKFGYRSVHYIVETKPAKTKHFAEIQIRTIFEEAWSEIDHTIRYPYDQDNPIFGQFLLILNRLAGSADEMGTFILYLKKEMQEKEDQHRHSLSEKDKLINELVLKINALKIKEPDLLYLTEGLAKLKTPETNWLENFKPIEYPDMSWIQNLNQIESTKLSWLDKVHTIEFPELSSLNKISSQNFSGNFGLENNNPIEIVKSPKKKK